MSKRFILLDVIACFVVSVTATYFLPTALGELMLRPGFRIAHALRISGDGDFVAIGLAMSWVLWSVPLALVVLVIRRTLWRKKTVLVAVIVVLFAAMMFTIRGGRNQQFEGTWEVGFERSDFFPSGQCWRPRYWLVGTPETYATLTSAPTPARRIKFIGNASSLGWHGHLGQYLREVQVVRVIEVSPSQPCRP